MSLFGWSYPPGCEGTPYDDEEPEAMSNGDLETLTTLADLCAYFAADTPRSLNRRIEHDTSCGASLSVQTLDGVWHHNGDNWSDITAIQAFTIQTIIEGSEATVESDVFVLPVAATEVDAWLAHMEAEAERLWDAAHAEDNEEEA
jgi:hypothetical protein